MRINCSKNLNLTIKLPMQEEVIIGNLKYNQLEINTDRRVANLYMNKIGFKPHIDVDGYSFCYEAEFERHKTSISLLRNKDCYSSFMKSIDITNTELVEKENILNGFHFIIPQNYEDKLVITKYETNYENEELNIVEKDTMIFKFEDKNIKIFKNELEVDLNYIDEFMNNVDTKKRYILEELQAFIYDKMATEIGFYDIYEDYRSLLSSYRNMTYSDKLKYIYYFGKIDFYYLVEFLIKNNMLADFKKHHPVITGKPIESVKDVKVLSKIGRKIFETHLGNQDIDILYKMEDCPKIGTNGLAIINEYLCEIAKLDYPYSSPFSIYRKDIILMSIYEIVNNFDITVKNLMDRCIRAMFNENISLNTYLSIIIDTANMATELNVELDKKLPMDICRIHDLLQEQITYVKNIAKERAFKEAVIKNKKLLNNIPISAEYTIIAPEEPSDLIYEGLRLNHCVGSYVNRYLTAYSKIFFIRMKSHMDVPYVTVELDRNNKLTQISGNSNKMPNKEIMEFVNEWIKNI